jgi:hypothetical protein
MAEDKRTAPGGKPRRRHTPQIDLTATEITTDEAQAPEPAPEPAAKPEIKPEAETAAEPPRAAASPPPPPSAMPTYAAVAGAVIGALLVGGGVLWFAGLPKENASAGQVNTRLSAIESQIRDLAQRPQAAPDNRPVEAVSQRIAKLEEVVSRPPPAPAPDTKLTERIASLESSLAAFNRRLETTQATAQQSPAAQAAIDGLSKRIETLEQSVKSAQVRVEDKIAQNSGADAAARQALAALVLRDAVSRGAPFAAELNALKNLGADPQAAARLEPFAASGVPAPQVLAQELSALFPSMKAASDTESTRSAGFLDKLEANASKLVRIRKVGDADGSDPAAVLARIEAHLSRSDIAAADKELAALPEKIRSPAEAWRRKVAARQGALDASRKLAADSAAALGGK